MYTFTIIGDLLTSENIKVQRFECPAKAQIGMYRPVRRGGGGATAPPFWR